MAKKKTRPRKTDRLRDVAGIEEEMPARTKRARSLIKRLHKTYPDARCALTHRTPLELLVATILSAQCTDERVNKVTPGLFATYQRAEDYARAEPEELQELIRSTGFFRNKAKSIQGATRTIVSDFAGQVPDTMDELLTLSGVARKTANVVLGVAFRKATGVVVDTHVFRLSHRMGLSSGSNADHVEKDLMALLPRGEWIAGGHLLIHHGRAICSARRPSCEKCSVDSLCPKIGVTPSQPQTKRPARAGRKPLRDRIMGSPGSQRRS